MKTCLSTRVSPDAILTISTLLLGFDLSQLLKKGGKRFRLCVRKVLHCYAKPSCGSRGTFCLLSHSFLRRTGDFCGVRTYLLTETEKVGCTEQGPSEECVSLYTVMHLTR